MTSERGTRRLTILLIISLGVNLWALTSIRGLGIRLEDLSQTVTSLRYSVSSEYNQLQRMINRLSEETSWVRDFNMDVDIDGLQADGHVPVRISWALNESPAGAEILMLYQPKVQSGTASWSEIVATSTAPGRYLAETSLHAGSDWRVQITARGDGGFKTSDVYTLDLARWFTVDLMAREVEPVRGMPDHYRIALVGHPRKVLPHLEIESIEITAPGEAEPFGEFVATEPRSAEREMWVYEGPVPAGVTEVVMTAYFADGHVERSQPLPIDGRPLPEPIILRRP